MKSSFFHVQNVIYLIQRYKQKSNVLTEIWFQLLTIYKTVHIIRYVLVYFIIDFAHPHYKRLQIFKLLVAIDQIDLSPSNSTFGFALFEQTFLDFQLVPVSNS